MRGWGWAFILIIGAALIPNTASASLSCFLCPPTCPLDLGVNIVNITGEYNAHVGPAGIEVHCTDPDGMLSNSGTDTFNATVIRISELQNAHAEKGDNTNYPFKINLSSHIKEVDCFYRSGCQNDEACVISLSADTNAHVGNCTQYDLKVCCSTSDVTGPICQISSPEWANNDFIVSWDCIDSSGIKSYNVQNNVSFSNGIPFIPWKGWLKDIDYTSAYFQGAQNNKTYYFRVNATDIWGFVGDWSPVNHTTYDNEPPLLSYSVVKGQEISIFSWALDNISGIAEHSIECAISNPEGSQTIICSPAAPFGGTSACQTNPIIYKEYTAITCTIKAKDRAGNQIAKEIFYATSSDHPIAEFADHSIFISIGENRHSKVYVRNLKSTMSETNVSLGGTYPEGLAKFIDSPLATRTSDGRNVTVILSPYEQKTLYVELISTDADEYTLQLKAVASNFPLTDQDEATITVGFNAAFPAIDMLSILAIIAISSLAFWKVASKKF